MELASEGVERMGEKGRVKKGGTGGGRIEPTSLLRVEILLDEGDR